MPALALKPKKNSSPIDIFTSEQFETELERMHSELGLTAFNAGSDEFSWARAIQHGEYVYWMMLDATVAIKIRSSILPSTGKAAESGENSIIVYAVTLPRGIASTHDERFLGGKLVRFITRLPGWSQRLQDVIAQINVMRLLAGDCPHCTQPLGFFKVAKPGANKGRMFAKCDTNETKCSKVFKWLTTGETL